MKNWIIGVIVLVLIIVGVVSMRGNKETGPIRIGVIALITGDAASYGEPAVNIYKLAVKEINQRRKMAIVVVEHNLKSLLEITDRAYVLDKGSVYKEGKPREIIETGVLERVFLGK